MGVGGVVFASGLAGAATGRRSKSDAGAESDFFFLQLSDTHWGYSGVSNPEADVTLPRAIETINAVGAQPDFVVFTGDLTHTTDDAAVRRKRMTEFRRSAGGLKVKDLRFLPGEHDAAKDAGDAFKEHFGADALRLRSQGRALRRARQRLRSRRRRRRRPDRLAGARSRRRPAVTAGSSCSRTGRSSISIPQWEWSTKDGAKVIDVLLAYPHVTVFYGHIHQEHHHTTEQIAHHAARSLVFALPAPGSVPKKVPAAWDPAAPFKGLGYRRVTVDGARTDLTELPVDRTT